MNINTYLFVTTPKKKSNFLRFITSFILLSQNNLVQIVSIEREIIFNLIVL